jgi:hypothetical protein
LGRIERTLEQCPSLLKEFFAMAAREKRQKHPHQRMVTRRPKEGYHPPHQDEIDDHGRDNQHDPEAKYVL